MNIASINQDKIKIDIVDENQEIKVVFSGDLDMADPGPLLDPFFGNIHEEIISGGIKKVILDFNNLTFLNSSGIKTIAKWIMKLAVMPEDKRYKMIIRQNKGITWQATSLPTLTYLVPGAVVVE